MIHRYRTQKIEWKFNPVNKTYHSENAMRQADESNEYMVRGILPEEIAISRSEGHRDGSFHKRSFTKGDLNRIHEMHDGFSTLKFQALTIDGIELNVHFFPKVG